jgi:DNA-binding response OmpR family regulator
MTPNQVLCRSIWKLGDVEVDADLYQVRVGTEVREAQRLTLDLLLYLAQNSWRVVPRQELRERVWGAHVSAAAINQAIMQARKVLGAHATSLRTIRGRGYQLLDCASSSRT